ncbi:hypothetical protein BGZ83_010083 [Gryganskiella cystojenkinii]|nr:hypothetical protein BGZ83_010083 [Gryganskiella cystojenkinii]
MTKESSDQLKEIGRAYFGILVKPFQDKYEEDWDEESFWKAVEQFKIRTKELGYDDPRVALTAYGGVPFESLRDNLKAGPPKCFRKGWKSEMLGESVDIDFVLSQCSHLHGPGFTGIESVVVLDLWATWCGECIKAAPEISELAENYSGKVAFVGINNDGIFEDKEHDVKKVRACLESNKEAFKFANFIDDRNYIRENILKKSGYSGVPCYIIIAKRVFTYVGPGREEFREALKTATEGNVMT